MGSSCKLNCRILFAPLYLLDVFLKAEALSITDKIRHLVFMVIVSLQWLLFFFSSGNLVFGVIIANLATLGFLVTNLYFQLNRDDYYAKDANFINSTLAILCTAIGTFFYQYLFAGMFPIFEEKVKLFDCFNISAVHFGWNLLQKIIGVILLFAWLLFAYIDRFKVFNSFPREKGSIWPIPLEKKSKIIIICIQLGGIWGWPGLIENRLFFFN